MPLTAVDTLNRSNEKTQIGLESLLAEGRFETEEQACTALRSVLHALRGTLTVDEAAHLSLQLPVTGLGVGSEPWRPAASAVKDPFAAALLQHAEPELAGELGGQAPHAGEGVLRPLEDLTVGDEAEHDEPMLNEDVRALWP